MGDLKYTQGTDVLAIRACYNSDASDLLAVAGEDSVQVLQCVSATGDIPFQLTSTLLYRPTQQSGI